MADRFDFLRSLEYLRNVPDDVLHEVAEDMREIDLPAGAVVFREGDEGDAVYIVVDGALSIEREGTQLVTRGSGEIVGEFALIDNHTRSATVIAATDVRLLKWLRSDFTAALARNTILVWGILNTSIDKLRQSTIAQYQALQPGESHVPESISLPGNDWVPEKTLVYQSAPMREILSLVDKIKHSASSVLITGESGTGKEMVARAIHHTSPYRDGAFVAINCGALPEALAESELFGHEKGAFTGAERAQAGKIELAHKGTLFLDEIGELPPALQVKLLRVLDDSRVLRLGASKPVKAEFRVIAATNRDIATEIETGHFRDDLFYRLAVIMIHIPPLRRRPEDIPSLADRFTAEISEQMGQPKRLDPGVIKYLVTQPWHGNVRELRNAIERAVMVSGARDQIEMDDIRGAGPSYGLRAAHPSVSASEGRLDELLGSLNLEAMQGNVLDTIEMILLELAIKQTGGNMSQAGKLLGLNYKQVTRRLKKYEEQRVEK